MSPVYASHTVEPPNKGRFVLISEVSAVMLSNLTILPSSVRFIVPALLLQRLVFYNNYGAIAIVCNVLAACFVVCPFLRGCLLLEGSVKGGSTVLLDCLY